MQLVRNRHYRIAAIFLVSLCLLSLAGAINPAPLPAIQLTSVDNLQIQNSDLPSKGNWLLFYVQPSSQFSDNLLKQFKREQYPGLEQHAVIIVGGSVDDLKNMKTKYAELSQATWYADTSKNAFTLLKLHGVPVILGINQQTIQWSLNGVLSDTNVSKSIVNTWIQQ